MCMSIQVIMFVKHEKVMLLLTFLWNFLHTVLLVSTKYFRKVKFQFLCFEMLTKAKGGILVS